MDQALLRVEEVARVINMGRAKTAAMIADGTIPSFKIGRSRRVHPDQLRRWMDEQAGIDRSN